MKRGFRSREAGARSRSGLYEVGEDVRAARTVGLRVFELRKRQAAADQRVNAARESLQRVDIAALEAELATALAEQAAIAGELSTLQDPAAPPAFEKSKTGRKAGQAEAEAVAAEPAAR